MERAIVYIDGFNLYYGLKDKEWSHYLWLDVGALGRSLAGPGQGVVGIKYFTARVGRPEASVNRQSGFLDAIQAQDPDMEVIFGNCVYREVTCFGCGDKWQQREEKKTDVAIALAMLEDAYEGRFDLAILVSADSDLVPAVERVFARGGKRVVNFTPPARYCSDLRKLVGKENQHKVTEEQIKNSQMPYFVKTDNHTIARPHEWGADGDG